MVVRLPDTMVKHLHDTFLAHLPRAEDDAVVGELQKAYWFYLDHLHVHASGPPQGFTGFIHRFVPLLGWQHSDVKTRVKAFWKSTQRMPRAGGILLNAAKTSVVLVRSPGSQRWGFPVGKWQPGPNESLAACAEREVFEETGFCGRLPPHAPAFEYRKGKALHSLFVFANVPEDYAFAPLSAMEIAEVRWFPFGDLARVLPRPLRQNLVHFLGVYVYPPLATGPAGPERRESRESRESPERRESRESRESPERRESPEGCPVARVEPVRPEGAPGWPLLSLEPFAPCPPLVSPGVASSCVRI